ncbi:MAG: preprotein translocase subunit SecG [Nitrospirae bacterium]|nr:preprotein translocase subunit SecG [Nitrospirota bacterium]
MSTLILIIHIITCVFLVFIVLIQSGKGAELGAAFGGSGQTLFGARGAATVLGKMTTGAAILFMLTSLSLAIVTNKGTSVVKTIPVKSDGAAQKSAPQFPVGSGPVQGTQPAAPAAPAAPAPAAPAK